MAYIRSALREQVRKRAGNRCEYCLVPEDFSYMIHEIDHIVAEKQGTNRQDRKSAHSLSHWGGIRDASAPRSVPCNKKFTRLNTPILPVSVIIEKQVLRLLQD